MPQTECQRATPDCPHPERWRMFDSMTAEAEVLEFLQCLVTTVKPQLVVETGTFAGVSTAKGGSSAASPAFGISQGAGLAA